MKPARPETDTRHCRATGSLRVTRSEARLGCGNRHGPLLGNGVTAGHEIGSEAGLWEHTRAVAGQRGHSGSRGRRRGWAVETFVVCSVANTPKSSCRSPFASRLYILYLKKCIGHVQWRNNREFCHFWDQTNLLVS